MKSLALLAVAACGGSPLTSVPDAQAPVDAAVAMDVAQTPDVVDEPMMEASTGNYPAFQPWMGQLSKNGGPVLTAPVIVIVTWDGDTDRGTFEAFGDNLGGSSYWNAAVGEWGIGAATSGATNHVHVPAPAPSQWTDSDVQSFIASNAGGLVPANTPQTIYVFFISSSTTFLFNGQNACGAIGGYHDNFSLAGKSASYAVIPDCAGANSRTAAASHEIGEASTDPQPSSMPGIVGFDDPYLAFQEWQRSNVENGDACEFFPDSYFIPASFPYEVQRLWSNKMGPLGHSPCQPYDGAYFNVAPLQMQDITVDLSAEGGPASFTTKGYQCALGQTIHIPIGFYSDAPTQPWTVSVAESNPLVNPVTGRLSLSVNPAKTTGVNGDQTYISVTVNNKGPLNAELLTVVSTLGQDSHYLPLLVGN